MYTPNILVKKEAWVEEEGTAMEDEVESTSSKMVPENVMEAVKNTVVNVEELRSNFDEFLSLSQPEGVLSHIPPLQRALSLLNLARATTTLFAVKLRCSGVDPDNHKVKADLERISRYQNKLDGYLALTKAPIQPSTKLNIQAANRFIQHSLPDLRAEQRRSLREIDRNEAGRISYTERNVPKKRKYHPPERPTVEASVPKFLEKAAYDFFDSTQGCCKEPIVPILIEDSSEEEKQVEEESSEIEESSDIEEDSQKEEPEMKHPPAPVFIIIDSSDED